MAYADRSLPDLLSGAAHFVRHVAAGGFEPHTCSICQHWFDLSGALDARALLHRTETARDLSAMASAGGYPPADGAPTAAPPQCLNCGEFLSAARVEMRLNSCGLCGGKPRRKGGR